MNTPHILLIDDDENLLQMLQEYLNTQDMQADISHSGPDALTKIKETRYNLLVLDIMMPEITGLELLPMIRAVSSVPVIMLTGRGDDIDRIVGLEMGADDYVTKPFDKRELFARVKNLLARIDQIKAAIPAPVAAAQVGAWTLDRSRRRLEASDGRVEPLTRAEYELLDAFMRNPGVILSRERLLEMTRHRQGAPEDRTIDVLVGRLRKKVEPDPARPDWIITVHGEGYLFVEDGD